MCCLRVSTFAKCYKTEKRKTTRPSAQDGRVPPAVMCRRLAGGDEALIVLCPGSAARKPCVKLSSTCSHITMIVLTGLMNFSPVKLFGIMAALPLLIPALCKQDSIGGGDIKLVAASGLVLGFSGGIAGLTISLTAMLLYFAGSKTVIRLRKDKNSNGIMKESIALPMAPFLSIGFIIVCYAKVHLG